MTHVYLGQRVKTGMQINATVYMVKRIDTEQDVAYIIPLDGSFCGQWHSIGALIQA